MSGIVGIYRRDGAPVRDAELKPMVCALMRRGPDRQGQLCRGPAGLGQTMLWTTPESRDEILPRVESPGSLAITADARLDNREDLIESLGVGGDPAAISDSALILQAYRKWGEECPAKLVGDFAFAIWDPGKQHLFCARDPMGVRGFYYYSGPALFAFASEIKALRCVPEVPTRLNELRVLDYFANFFDDRAITFYRDIYRLPAASSLTVGRKGIRIARYWELDPKYELKLHSDQEYAEAFRDVFAKAVRARLRSDFPIGSTVSGGLDSSSVACLTRRQLTSAQPLHTFSLIFPSYDERILRQIDERAYIDAVLQRGGFEPHFVRADELSPLGRICEMHRCLDEAFFAGNTYLHWEMFATAQRHGVRVFLDGFDGDTTVSHGFEYLADLVSHLKWWTLRREGRLLTANVGIPPRQFLRNYCIKPFCPAWVFKGWRRFWKGTPATGRERSVLDAGFKQRQGFEQRAREMFPDKRSCWRNAREKHMEMINFPLYAQALEVADKASAAFQVESRYPFFDRRLIEFCLAIPPRQKLSQGWPRWILRRAMDGILPEKVQWRATKANLSPNFYTRLLERDRRMVESVVMDDPSPIEPYIDIPSLRRAYHAYNTNPLRRHDDSMNVFTAVNFALWMKTAGIRP